MTYKKDFDMFVGGKSGVLKGIKIDDKACIIKNIQSLVSIRAEHAVTAMSWADENEKDILIACGYKGDRSVKIYDTEHSSFTGSFACDAGTGDIKGLSRYGDAVITAVESGHVKLWRFDEGDESIMETGENLERMRHSAINKNIIATGGKEHRLQLFDIEKKKKIFEEKNVRNDWLELKVPIWISDIGFLRDSSQIVTCGRLGHVRLYDTVAQRRPVMNLEVKDEALTTLAVTSRDKSIIIGSGRGTMKLIDLRKPGKILNTYKDFVGGITSIVCSQSNPYIASVSLDRFLRVHHLDTKALLKKVYLTSRLSGIVLRSNFSMENDDGAKDKILKSNAKRSRLETNDHDDISATNDDSNSEIEYDAMFDEMAVIENEENEADLLESEAKRCKTKVIKTKNCKVSKNTLRNSKKKFKKSPV